MQKLRAALFSFGARGRLGGHRRAPGAPLAPVGPMWHKDLLGLGAHDHPQYPLILGAAGGQTLHGGLAASQHLTLQSTAHASRGYVRALDDLQLLSNVLRGSDGSARLSLAATMPHISLAGDVAFSGFLGSPTPYNSRIIHLQRTLATGMIPCGIAAFITSTGGHPIGVYGGAYYQGAYANRSAKGLDFQATSNTAAAMNQLIGLYMQVNVYGAGNVSNLFGGVIQASYVGAGRATIAKGLYIGNFGKSGTGTAMGLHIYNQQDSTVNTLIEAGPSSPYLRLSGGVAPGAGFTQLYLREGATLRRMVIKDGAAIGAGDRVCILI